MPVDIQLLKRKDVSAAAYKKVWTQDYNDLEKPQKKLLDLIASRCREGKIQNLSEWQAWHAIDLAYDVPFNQTTPTLVNNILSRHLNAEQTVEALKEYGLDQDELFLKIPMGNGQTKLQLNPPVFFQIFVPVVKAYTAVRLARIFNERNVNPLLPYDPLLQSDRNQMLCEMITGMVNRVSINYGYPAVMRQCIQQMLKYGVMLTFPREEWHHEAQLVSDDANGEKEVTVREGIRYLIPHPAKMFYDLNHPLTTLNSNSGCEFVGMWQVVPYSEILDNRQYWNRDRIFCGTNWFTQPGGEGYFRQLFPCQMKFPSNISTLPMSREDKANWYQQSGGRDQSVFKTNYFQKLVPKEWMLGDYKYPVWMRFDLAGDDNIIWSAPCAYTPSWFMGYDYDENTGRTPSMALECIPWQDELGNILSQIILTAKQNLENTVFYDTNLINKEDIEAMKNLGETKYRSTQYLGFDSLKRRMSGLDQRQAFQSVNLTKVPLQELFQLIPTVLNIMERVLQISAQEVGGQGSHQQSKYELQQLGGAGGSRVALTCSYVDEGIDAWERQLYDGCMAYIDPEFVAEISADIPGAEKLLTDLGFKIVHSGPEKLVVRGKKQALRVEGFARTHEGSLPRSESEVAQVLFQTVGIIAAQQDLHQKVGSKNLLSMIEFAAKLAGAPRDWRLKQTQDDQGQAVPANVLDAIKQAQAATLQEVEAKIAQPAAQQTAQMQGEVQQLQAMIEQLKGIYQFAKAQSDKNAIKAADSQANQQRKNQAEIATQQRKDLAAQKELERKQVESQAKIATDAAEAQAKILLDAKQTEADIALKKAEAAAKPQTA